MRSSARNASRSLPFANSDRARTTYVSVGEGTGSGVGAGALAWMGGRPVVACTGNHSVKPLGATITNEIAATRTIAAAVIHHMAIVPRR